MSDPSWYVRQSTMVPADRLRELSIGIAGCGAIGRQLALQLAAMGAHRLYIADHDRIEPANMATQGWRSADIGRSKVQALTSQLCELNPELMITGHIDRFPLDRPAMDVLFMCVDTIDARRQLFEAYRVQEGMELIVDGRMGGETIKILTFNALAWNVDRMSGRPSTSSVEAYRRTLFAAERAFAARCTSRSTIYLANLAAALMASQLAAYLRGRPLATEITLGVASLDLTSVHEAPPSTP